MRAASRNRSIRHPVGRSTRGVAPGAAGRPGHVRACAERRGPL